MKTLERWSAEVSALIPASELASLGLTPGVLHVLHERGFTPKRLGEVLGNTSERAQLMLSIAALISRLDVLVSRQSSRSRGKGSEVIEGTIEFTIPAKKR